MLFSTRHQLRCEEHRALGQAGGAAGVEQPAEVRSRDGLKGGGCRRARDEVVVADAVLRAPSIRMRCLTEGMSADLADGAQIFLARR